MSEPTVRWIAGPAGALWHARYRGWVLYASEKSPDVWFASLHRSGKSASCLQVYATLEGAQNAAEFYAEQGRWPHEQVAS